MKVKHSALAVVEALVQENLELHNRNQYLVSVLAKLRDSLGAEAAPAAAKKRPRRINLTSDAAPKRGRGRPKKSAAASSADAAPKRRGRPPGSKNKPKTNGTAVALPVDIASDF